MDNNYQLRLCQLERAKGELRALWSIWYDPYQVQGGKTYQTIKPMIEKFVNDLTDCCG